MNQRALLVVLIVSLLIASAAPSRAHTCGMADFDNDDDPMSIRHELPPGQMAGEVKFILVNPEIGNISGLPFTIRIKEGCCRDGLGMPAYGTRMDVASLHLYPELVQPGWTVSEADVMYGCGGWVISGRLRGGLELAPGERFFIGEVNWEALCFTDTECVVIDRFGPPTAFTARFSIYNPLMACDPADWTMAFDCGATPATPSGWGSVKSLYR